MLDIVLVGIVLLVTSGREHGTVGAQVAADTAARCDLRMASKRWHDCALINTR
jgi:hypothetical protein